MSDILMDTYERIIAADAVGNETLAEELRELLDVQVEAMADVLLFIDGLDM